MACGDHFFLWRRHLGIPFQHHGVDVGNGRVIHFSDGAGGVAGPGSTPDRFEICCAPIEQVTREGRDTVHVVDHPRRLSPDLVVKRAESQLGRRGYDLIFDNCEHFACWCVVGRRESGQVNVACHRAGAASVKAIASGAVRAAATAGTARIIRGASPWLLVADLAQWATEAGGHHVGLRNPLKRQRAGLAVGGVAAAGVGVLGGPAGVAVAGGIWLTSELAGMASRRTYQHIQSRRR